MMGVNCEQTPFRLPPCVNFNVSFCFDHKNLWSSSEPEDRGSLKGEVCLSAECSINGLTKVKSHLVIINK